MEVAPNVAGPSESAGRPVRLASSGAIGSSGSFASSMSADGNLAPVRPTPVVRFGLARRLLAVTTSRDPSFRVIPAPFGGTSELRTNLTHYDRCDRLR